MVLGSWVVPGSGIVVVGAIVLAGTGNSQTIFFKAPQLVSRDQTPVYIEIRRLN